MIEQRKGKHAKPVLSGSARVGAIEQDADLVMFIHARRTMTSARMTTTHPSSRSIPPRLPS